MPEPSNILASENQPIAGNHSLELKVQGQDVSAKAGVLSVSVRHELNRVGRMSLTLQDTEGAKENYQASEEFYPGYSISLTLTKLETGTVVKLFAGIVTEASMKLRNGNPVLYVEARHETVRMTQGRFSATFNEESDHEALERIIDKYSFRHDIPDSSIKQNSLVQFHTSDWDFFLSRIEANGWVLATDQKEIRVFTPKLETSSSFSFQLGINIADFEGKISGQRQATEVKAQSWDPDHQKLFSEEVDQTGDEKYDLDGNPEAALLHGGARKEPELKAWATATAQRIDLSRIRGRVLSKGIVLALGQTISISGMGKHFEGDHLVSGIRHEISDGQWLSHVQFGMEASTLLERQPGATAMPASGLLPAVHGLQVGTVDKLEDDPEEGYRIKVILPLLGEQNEGVWARIAQFDAGNKRGSYFIPHEGEEVIMGFLNGDPRDPVILGSLYSQENQPPLDHKQANEEKGFFGKNGLHLKFNEEENIIELKTKKGNLIRLTEEDSEIRIEDQNENKWVLDDSGISLKTPKNITLEADGNVEIKGNKVSIKAQSEFIAEANGTATLKSTAQTVIKGGVVNIN